MRTTRYITLCIILLLCSIAVPLQGNAVKEFTTTITFQVTEGEQIQTIGLRNNEEFSSAIVREHTKIIIGDNTNNATYVTWNEDARNTSEEKIYFKPYYIEEQKQKENIFLRFFVPQQYIQDNTTIETLSLTVEITTVIETDNYLYGRLPALIPTDDVTVQPQETIEYLIITNSSFYSLANDNYAAWKKETDGKINTIRIVNISDIESEETTWVNGTYGDATNASNGNPFIPDGKEVTSSFDLFNDTQCHIRNYIRYMVDTYNTSYVLLLGNKDVVPPRMVEMHAHSGPSGSWYNYSAKPSDMYYSNLDYCMNNNTNSVWMECQLDGFYWIGGGDGVADYDEIDWAYDVLVGRALIDSTQEAYNWINKTKEYIDGKWQGNYLRNGIVASKDTNNNIDDSVWNMIGDEFSNDLTFLNGQNISNTQFNNMYDYCNGIQEGWDGFNIIHHTGHSGTHSGTLWDVYRPALLNNTYTPNFVYSEGCHAGDFSASVSCIEDWIRDDACMVAGVSNSCWGWFTASTWYGEEMFAQMFNESRAINESVFARAHMESKIEVPQSTHPVCPMIIKETNYFGDPALEFQSHDVIYVDDDANESWYDATHVQTIQEGIAKVAIGGMVQVYNGTYALDDELYINKSLFLIGEEAEACLIERNGTAEHRLLTIENLWDNQTTVDGFTFSGGYANMSNRNGCGGNIYIANSLNATINNSIIKEGYAAQYGGGVHLEAGGQVANSSIYNNDVVNSGMNAGGGISLRYGGNVVKQCYISNNSAPIGGGILVKMGANPPNQNKILHCTVANNTAHGYYGTYYGGGIASQGSGWTTSEINDSIIYYNMPNNVMDLDSSLNMYYSITTPAWGGSGNNNDADIPRFSFNDTAINNTHYILHSCSPARATASDGTNRGAYQGSWYKPCPNYAPLLGDPNPGDNATNQRTDLTWSIPIEDINWEDTFNWTITCNNSQQSSATNDNDGIKELYLTNLERTTHYIVWVNATDGDIWTNNTFTFNTTSNLPPFTPQDCTVESMTGFGDGYCSVYDTYLNATVSDPDGDAVNVSYYLNGVKVNEMSDVTNGSAVSLCVSNISNASYWDNGTFEPRNIFNHTSTYSWYVEVDDGIDIETSATQYFTTSEPWDLIEDGDMNLDDITQALVVDWYYLDEPTEVGGKIPSDINDDGYIDLNDLSLFSSHWYDDTWYE